MKYSVAYRLNDGTYYFRTPHQTWAVFADSGKRYDEENDALSALKCISANAPEMHRNLTVVGV